MAARAKPDLAQQHHAAVRKRRQKDHLIRERVELAKRELDLATVARNRRLVEFVGPHPEYGTVSAAAELFGVSRQYAWKLVRDAGKQRD